jgi:PAS domain S-box-containing protein
MTSPSGSRSGSRRRATPRWALLETAAQAIIGITATESVVLANAAAETMFGYTREEMLDQPIEVQLPERLRPPHLRDWSAFLQKPQNRPMEKGMDKAGVRKDGTEFPAEVKLSQVARPMETWL